MIRRTKPAKKDADVIKGYKPLYVGRVEISFKKEVSLVLPTYAMYMGELKAFLLSKTDKGWVIQCNLPHLPVFPFPKPVKSEQEARQMCIKGAHSFCSLLNHEQ